jgi:Ras family
MHWVRGMCMQPCCRAWVEMSCKLRNGTEHQIPASACFTHTCNFACRPNILSQRRCESIDMHASMIGPLMKGRSCYSARAHHQLDRGDANVCQSCTDAAVLVFDITDVESFRRVRSWVAELRQMVRMCPESVVDRNCLLNLACAQHDVLLVFRQRLQLEQSNLALPTPTVTGPASAGGPGYSAGDCGQQTGPAGPGGA